MRSPFISVKEALDEFRQGHMLILVDDEDRENEGDLIIAAQKITPDAINFMLKNARGLLCLSLHESDTDRLQLPLMVENNKSNFQTAFTQSIEAAKGVTTGISVQDRVRTIKVAINPSSTAADIVMPGHIFPLKARVGGVLARAGHTEGSVDLARLAGLSPNAVISEVMNDDGTMARLPDLIEFGEKHNIKLVSVKELITYRLEHDCLVEEIATSGLPIDPYGEFTIKVFKNHLDNLHHIALIRGEVSAATPILVRMHSECLTGDTFGSTRCDCGWQLRTAINAIAEQGGVLLYMRQEGRGIGLANKILAYALQDQGLDTVEANQKLGFKADHRDYTIGGQILAYLGVKKVLLMTNNPEKINALRSYGIEVTSRVSLEMQPTQRTRNYLQTKRDKLGHLLKLIK